MSTLRLKELIKEKGISTKDFASKVGISYNYSSELVRGDKFPRQDTLIEIAKALDVDIRELFNPTKETQSETIYVKRDGKDVPVGKLLKD